MKLSHSNSTNAVAGLNSPRLSISKILAARQSYPSSLTVVPAGWNTLATSVPPFFTGFLHLRWSRLIPAAGLLHLSQRSLHRQMDPFAPGIKTILSGRPSTAGLHHRHLRLRTNSLTAGIHARWVLDHCSGLTAKSPRAANPSPQKPLSRRRPPSAPSRHVSGSISEHHLRLRPPRRRNGPEVRDIASTPRRTFTQISAPPAGSATSDDTKFSFIFLTYPSPPLRPSYRDPRAEKKEKKKKKNNKTRARGRDRGGAPSSGRAL